MYIFPTIPSNFYLCALYNRIYRGEYIEEKLEGYMTDSIKLIDF